MFVQKVICDAPQFLLQVCLDESALAQEIVNHYDVPQCLYINWDICSDTKSEITIVLVEQNRDEMLVAK